LDLQNAGSAVANVSVQFYNQVTGAAVGSPYVTTIPVSATKVYTMSAMTPPLPTGNTNGLLSAKVTSDQPLAGIATIWTAAVHGEFASYNGFSGGGTTAYVPALYFNYYNFGSALTVQNIGTAPTDITVTYSNNFHQTSTAVPAGAAIQYYLPNYPLNLPSGNVNGVFSAKITSSGQPIVATVNTEDKNKGSLASYPGVNAPTTTVLCPVVMKAYYQWFTAETVQNVGTAATNITVTYPGGFTKVINNVPVNGTVNVIELATSGSVLPDGSTLAATITASQPLVAVTQENSNTRYTSNPGDYLFSYTCANQ
jgi:hypothetical protein